MRHPLRDKFLMGTLAVLLAACVGATEYADLPPPDPPGQWRWITQDDATTTSQCIGRPETPVCAIETMIACFTRDEGKLCRRGHGLDKLKFETFRKGAGTAFKATKYRFLSSKRLAEEDIPEYERLACEHAWKLGDLRIEVRRAGCWRRGSEFECKGTFAPEADLFQYILRQSGDRWNVVIWADLGNPERPRFKIDGCYKP